jgi:alkylation response protein AidB-like acyl-CoA dehydrogenase
MFTRAGDIGMFPAIPEEFGGSGNSDFRYNVVLSEEAARSGVSPAIMGISLQNEICMPYFLELTNAEQKRRWLPGIGTGESITAVAMTEPGTGSDLSGISTKAVLDGDDFVINGAKTFITNGINADLIITAVRTGEHPHRGLSLIVIERDTAGLKRGRNLAKVGMHAQDTAELSFIDARVPRANLLGAEGEGFFGLTRNLPQERLGLAVQALAQTRAAFDWTIEYVRDRKAFGKSIGALQNTRFVMAEMATEIDFAQAYVDRAVLELNEKSITAVDAAKAKWWCTELLGRVVDRCVQLHGGYGYMLEYPIARLFLDARVSRIYGGTTEIMKEIIGRSLELELK